MRLATYNIWNSPVHWNRRLSALAMELEAVDADVVALQEAPLQAEGGQPLADYLGDRLPYPYIIHPGYPVSSESAADSDPSEPEGLAVLSRRPLDEVRTNWSEGAATDNNWALSLAVGWRDRTLSITVVHLDWSSEDSRARQLALIIADLAADRSWDHALVLGDFNGAAPLLDDDPAWRDLDLEAQTALGGSPLPTLDFATNPRWHDELTDQTPIRADRIYLRSRSEWDRPTVLRAAQFGRDPLSPDGTVASDHYGVFVDLELPPDADAETRPHP